MQTGEYKHKQTKRFPLALITVQLGEFMVGMHLNNSIDRKYNTDDLSDEAMLYFIYLKCITAKL